MKRDFPVVWFDSDCLLCNRSIEFILEHEQRPELRFGSLHSREGQELLETLFGKNPLDSIIYQKPDGRCFYFSKAAFAICEHLETPWRWIGMFRIIPHTLSDWVYRQIARSRHRVFSNKALCALQNPLIFGRLLESASTPTPAKDDTPSETETNGSNTKT